MPAASFDPRRLFGWLRSITVSVAVFCVTTLCATSALADEAEGHYRMGLTHKRNGKIADAIKEVKEAVRQRPDHAAAWMTLGGLERQRNDFGGALLAYDKVIALSPEHQQAYALSGAILVHLQKYEQAVERLKKALELDKDKTDTTSAANLGMALRKLKRNAEAIQVMQEAAKKNPDDPDLLNNLGVALRHERRYEEAIAAFEQAREKRPDDLELLRNLAITLRGVERFKDAIPHYEKYVAQKPNDDGMLYDLANCYEKMGAGANAVRTYKRYVDAINAKDPAAAERARKRISEIEASAF